MKGREETVEGSGMQNWNKEPRHKTAAMTQQGIQQDPQETLRLEIGKRTVRIFNRLWENKDRTFWRGRHPPKRKKNLLSLLEQC
jgi:hypothetical protein